MKNFCLLTLLLVALAATGRRASRSFVETRAAYRPITDDAEISVVVRIADN